MAHMRTLLAVLTFGVSACQPPGLEAACPAGPVRSPSGPVVASLRMFDRDQGWAVIDDALFRTQDGARSFDEAGPTGITSPLGASIVDASAGWLIAGTPAAPDLLRTSDTGRTWTRVASLPPIFDEEQQRGFFGARNKLVLLPDGRGWLALEPGGFHTCLEKLYATKDGG